MIIGLTDTMGAERKWQQYIDWLLRGNPSLRWKKLSYKLDNLSLLKECDGLVLTGGGDVDPVLYGGNVNHPKVYGVDRKRDDFERSAIDVALQSGIPVLGICRGLQIANVHFGGTLVEDLAEHGHPLHETNNEYEQRHDIVVEQNSLLSQTTQRLNGNVNSYHHQAAAEAGKGLRVAARSNDGVIEAMELDTSSAKQFFLLIQWHPERMKDFENPFSHNVLQQFLRAVNTISEYEHQ
jgi:putative glutamine amidotransferase